MIRNVVTAVLASGGLYLSAAWGEVPGALACGVFSYLLAGALFRLVVAGIDRAVRDVDRKNETSATK